MIVLDAPVQRRVRELRDRQLRLRRRVSAVRSQVRVIVVDLPPEPAHSDEAAAFASELDEHFPTVSISSARRALSWRRSPIHWRTSSSD